jgi:hypothetical protein
VSAFGYAVWGLVGAATLALAAVSRTPGSGLARPVQVVRRLASGPVLRVVLVVAIGWIGWHLFAR